MDFLRIFLIVLGIGLSVLPVSAGGISFDLPRLDFPPPVPQTTRGSTAQTTCVAPAR